MPAGLERKNDQILGGDTHLSKIVRTGLHNTSMRYQTEGFLSQCENVSVRSVKYIFI